ncbi:MAG: hypothetical protein HY472_00895 [Candidatus Sungbacteria bacterium]|nr:hypothetical protein [Candidatus Sungbacteria bacterium]
MDSKERQRLLGEKKREVEEWAERTLILNPHERFQIILSIKDTRYTLGEEDWNILRSLPISPVYKELIEFFWEQDNKATTAQDLMRIGGIKDILKLFGRISNLNALLSRRNVAYRLRKVGTLYDSDKVCYEFFVKKQ